MSDFHKYKKQIKSSNVRSILYISSTGVYGNHEGNWVDEKSTVKGKDNTASKSRINAEKAWIDFCKKAYLTINIVRLGAIYGPKKPNIEKNDQEKADENQNNLESNKTSSA